MELRVHSDVGAIETPTGLISRYEDLERLFQEVLQRRYSKEDYMRQFTIRVPENLAKIERVEKFYKEKVTDVPEALFEVLSAQRNRLLKAQKQFVTMSRRSAS